MNELFERLEGLSVGELEELSQRIQKLIVEKRLAAQRQAEMERQRQEQERLDAERKKQEEIAALQRRLQELQGNGSSGQPKAQDQGYSMISCPGCHKLIPSHSQFCFYCGRNTKEKSKPREPASSEPSKSGASGSAQALIPCPRCGAAVPPGSQFCHSCGSPMGNAHQGAQQSVPKKSSVFMEQSMKKWDKLSGEADIMDWKEASVTQPEQQSFAHIKITSKRILISVESRMQRGLRNSGGIISALASHEMEAGKPWVMIPLEGVVHYRLISEKEIRIEADRTFVFHNHNAAYLLNGTKVIQQIYSALRQVLPEKAR